MNDLKTYLGPKYDADVASHFYSRKITNKT